MTPTTNCIERLKETGYDKWETRDNNKVVVEYVSEAFQDKSKAELLLTKCQEAFQEIFELVDSRQQKGFYRVLIPRDKIPASSYTLNQQVLASHILLPNKILLQIVSYLPIKELGRLMCVNRKCYALANDSTIWKKIALSQEEQTSLQPVLHPKHQLLHSDLNNLKKYLNFKYAGKGVIKELYYDTEIIRIEFKKDKQEYLFKILSDYAHNEKEAIEVYKSPEQISGWLSEMKSSDYYTSRKRKHSEL